MGKRVVITGLGCINGLGQNYHDVWNSLIEGKSGISHAESIDLSGLPVSLAGEVKNFSIDEDLLNEREAPRYDRYLHFALQAGKEAMINSGLLNDPTAYRPENMGSILGVGIGGFPMIEMTHKIFLEKGVRRISPFFIPGIIPNMASGLLSIKYNLKGINYSISSACASAAHAIGQSYDEIKSGRHDVMLTGGAEAAIGNLAYGGFIAMKALSKHNADPTKASRPFDINRDGFVMGEGAGILILEDYEKAKTRGANIIAEICGMGATSDAYHITAPQPEGLGAVSCMKKCLESSKLDPTAIGYINAHGTSTPLGDIAETRAIRETFGRHANNLFVSSTKSMTGHLLGAAGGVESVFCALALKNGILPPTINLDNQDPECDLDYVANQAKKYDFEYALNNSFGFGGTNASLILKKI